MVSSKLKVQDSKSPVGEFVCRNREETFSLGENLGKTLRGGEVILLSGNLGAGKTLFTKGILNELDFDIDEVTSPSFTLVNLYKADLTVYHIDFYRLDENTDVAFAVGLEEILEDDTAVTIIEWAERLNNFSLPEKVFRVSIEGDGDDSRIIKISR